MISDLQCFEFRELIAEGFGVCSLNFAGSKVRGETVLELLMSWIYEKLVSGDIILFLVGIYLLEINLF